MAQYIGQGPVNGFHARQSLTGDGSETTFTLDQTVASETAMIVSVDGVLQEPSVAYTLTTGGTKVVFASAPSGSETVYVHFLGTAVVQNLLDINGSELILDVDGDTTLTADTDDEIDIKVGGTDRSTIKATGFHNLDSIKFVAGTGDDMQMYHDGSNSYLTNSTGALKIATETSGIAVTIGHSTSEVTIADNATVAGNLTVTGTLTQTGTQTFDGGIDVDNFNLNGTTLSLSSGDMLIDVAGDITFDADGGDFKFSDGGTQILNIANSSSDVVIKPTVDSKDIIFQQYDGTEVARIEDNATFNVSSAGGFAYAGTAVTSTAAELNIVDGGTSATSTTVADADRVVMNDNGTMVQVAVTDLAAYFDDEITAMPNLTSVGTLTALTVDDVAVNGKVITMTGSASDTAVFTAGTNGTLDIVTTDAGGAAANIQITADGTAELAGTTVTLDSAGGITLDADGGTITFADAGSSLGTITSSGYSGTSAAATTVTVTDNEDTNENNVLVFVAGADSDGGTGLGLESDGNLTYNPSTGTLSATNLVVSGTQTVTNSVVMNSNNAVVFEGATADASETTLSSIDATADRTINLPNQSGTLPVLAAASATQITATPEEINLIDGGTARGTTAVASGDGILTNDGGTMRMTNVDTFDTYFSATTKTLTNKTLTTPVIAEIDSGSTITLDATTDIILDADGGDIFFKDGGTTIATHSNSSSDYVITTGVQDKDFVIKGDDGGSTITPLTIDMSAGGDLFLTGGLIDLKNDGSAVSQIKFYCEASNAHAQTLIGAPHSESATNTLTLPSTGGNSYLVTAASTATLTNKTLTTPVIDTITRTGDFTIDASGDIILDADGANVTFKDGGTAILDISNSSSDAVITSSVQDKDIIFKGDDGGSAITALTLDMSAAGEATFNGAVYSSGKFGLNDGDYINHVDNTRKEFVVNGNEEMRLEADGDLHVDNDVIAFSSTISDERLKENIQPIEDALSKVSQLNGVTFTYKADGKESAGLIAQDVEKVLPSAITEKELPLKIDDGNEYKVLQYDQTIGLLVEAIKELTAKVEELEKK